MVITRKHQPRPAPINPTAEALALYDLEERLDRLAILIATADPRIVPKLRLRWLQLRYQYGQLARAAA